MNDLDLLIQLHITQDRQGPGSEQDTMLAAKLAGLDSEQALKIADIGCGTGTASLDLAKNLNCEVTSVDFLPEFIEKLKSRATEANLSDKINPVVGDMGDLPFEEDSFDVLWSEGAVYNIGFETGIRDWRKYLKSGGTLVVSELTWLTEERPTEITEHWNREYPEVATAGEKIRQLEQHGYKLLGYFPLSEVSWNEEYYKPLQARYESLKAEYPDRLEAVQGFIDENEREIELYNKYKDFVSYGVYIAKKVD
ncbi:class I SAM-dependent methyltransferase [Vibrio ishigakensis]|uniref:class I SAM-dependent methyltransferase n=1 Tax=Vibrio ishigakensis TaxID=1481914 RepID=UPI0021C48F56|nr:class I SAM-dependent methyltransferase [Vibrio ishigakensis]